MEWNSEHAYLLMTRQKAINLFHNVKPRRAKWLIDEIKNYFDNLEFEILISDSENEECLPYKIKNLVISKQDYDQLLITVDGRWNKVDYITPEGAGLLLKMYHHGCFELNKNICGDTLALENYASSGEHLFQQYIEDEKKKKKKQAQERYWREHPEELPEINFTASRLNGIMWHNNKIGSQVTMEIGGILVTKEVSRYSSNSGKSRDNKVVFKWIDSDGKCREELLVDSVHQHNRRNDATRNWGLPD